MHNLVVCNYSVVTDNLTLDRQVCFALYSASRAMTARYRPMLDSLGVTYPQYLVLLVLWERDGRGLREICDAFDLDTGTLSPLLKRLETRAWSTAGAPRPTSAGSGSTSPSRARAPRRRGGHPAELADSTGMEMTNSSPSADTLSRLDRVTSQLHHP